ncbi:hypothetical protein C4546_04125 [Candidatus Parcubacteria bacterium]|jgi:hypothetical protein|nr:MAG: hypothetical protein C4546_04125 [Candidatus Parcubacteria bacterium]
MVRKGLKQKPTAIRINKNRRTKGVMSLSDQASFGQLAKTERLKESMPQTSFGFCLKPSRFSVFVNREKIDKFLNFF